MFLTLVYILTSIKQWYVHRRQNQMYLRALGNSIKKSSLLFQQPVSVTRELSPFLKNVLSSRFVARVVQDDNLHIVSVHPVVTVPLREWHFYRNIVQDDLLSLPQDIHILLLEASITPDLSKENTGNVDENNCELEESSFCLQIQEYGQTLAWKAGVPCSVLMTCNTPSLLNMGLALKNGQLQFQELKIGSILSVKTEGTGSSLLLPPAVKESLKRSNSDHSIDDRDFCCQSNEALASPCETVNNSEQDEEELLLDSETEMAAGDIKYEKLEADDEIKTADSSFAQSKKTAAKPPNITVYCGKEDSKESFDRIRSVLEQCVDKERYVIYQVVHNEMNTVPWSDNTELLVLASEESCKDVDEVVLTYLERGGNIISFGGCVDNVFLKMEALASSGSVVQMSCHKWNKVVVKCGGLAYTDVVKMPEYNCSVLARDDASNKPLIVKLHSIVTVNPEPSLAILSQVRFDADPSAELVDILSYLLSTHLNIECASKTVPDLTPGLLLAKSKKLKKLLLRNLSKRLKDGTLNSSEVSLKFVHSLKEIKTPASSSILPVITHNSSEEEESYNPKYFKADMYWTNLHSTVLGTVVLYVDVVPTTMNLLNQMVLTTPKSVGLIAIAGRQTSGKGRGGNQWLSPIGCAMFTMHIKIDRYSNLGQNPAYLQHIITVAVVQSVRTLPGYEDFDLRVKWPNDLYFGKSSKLGGVLVNSSVTSSAIDAIVGCGFNVSNSKPTLCINDLIQQHNIDHGTELEMLDKDQLIARTVTIIEELINRFNVEGHKDFQKLYYKYWIHSGAKVKLESENNIDVEVDSLDDNGYLQVRAADGRLISVHPDGNRFDFMKNLIALKK